MSSRQDGGGRGKESFVSAHRCPEVDLLPHHDAETRIPLLCSLVPAVINSELTCIGQSEANYLDAFSCHHTENEEKEEGEEGSISDWSEEDLSLHFSPSVILPSDDEEFDSESGFECVDVTMESQVRQSVVFTFTYFDFVVAGYRSHIQLCFSVFFWLGISHFYFLINTKMINKELKS